VNTPNDGGPAFPCQPLDGQGMPCNTAFTGMTIRDYAEIHFMAALIQKRSFCTDRLQFLVGDEYESLHVIAGELADAMLNDPKF